MSIDRKKIFEEISELKIELKNLDVTPEFVSMQKLDNDDYLIEYLDALRDQVWTRRKFLARNENAKQGTTAKK